MLVAAALKRFGALPSRNARAFSQWCSLRSPPPRFICTTRINLLPVARMASTAKQVRLNENLSFVDNSKSGNSNEQQQAAKNRTLVLIFSWMLAKGQHLDKFAQFYGKYGYDVLLIKTLPMQLMFPKNGTMQNAKQVVQFVAGRSADYSNIFVHGFSVGAYQFGEVLVQMSQDKEAAKKISPLFRGLVFDSAANLAAIPDGFSKALTTFWPLQKLLFVLLHLYLKMFYFVSTKYYKESEREFLEMNHFRVPSLLLVSERDPVGSVASNQEVADSWTKRGIPVRMKVWKDSKHVGHYYKHPEEYEQELKQMIDKIK